MCGDPLPLPLCSPPPPTTQGAVTNRAGAERNTETEKTTRQVITQPTRSLCCLLLSQLSRSLIIMPPLQTLPSLVISKPVDGSDDPFAAAPQRGSIMYREAGELDCCGGGALCLDACATRRMGESRPPSLLPAQLIAAAATKHRLRSIVDVQGEAGGGRGAGAPSSGRAANAMTRRVG